MTKRNLTAAKVARAGKSGIRTALMLSTGALALVAAAPALAQVPPVDALPGGGTIVGGTGTINAPVGNHLQVDQASDRLLINWNNFDIGQDASVDFAQTGGQAIAVNRVTGSGAAPSLIFGDLTANGTVVIINGNGVVFGGTADVDVGRLVATTSDINDQTFMSGGALQFSGLSSDAGAISILSNASITVADAGLAAFVAPQVSNAGVITARGGRVVLASGVDYTLDLAGDGLIEFALGADSPLVTQAGEILAEGGLVQITAAAAAGLISDVINVSGAITVTSADLDDGVIVLSAGEGDGGDINFSADLTVAGDIEVEGRRIHGAGDIDVTDGELVLSVNAGGADTTGETLIADALGVIGGVDGGTTVNLGAGLYAAGANVTASNVTLDGHDAATIVVDGTPLAGLTISGDSVTVRNLAIVGPVEEDHRLADWGAELSTVGIVVNNGAENATITGNEITNIRTGIRLHGGGNAGAEVAGNYIENTKGAILVQYTDGAGLDIFGNSQGPLGNEWGVVVNLNTGTPLNQHATAGAQSNIMALSDGNNGMTVLDRAYAWSNRSHVFVDDDSSVTPADDFDYGNGLGNERQALHTVQAGVIAVAAGGTVRVRAGVYDDPLNITKSVSVLGAGVGETILRPSATLATGIGHKYDANMNVAVFVSGADNVVLDGLTIDGNGLNNNAAVFWHNASGTISNAHITNVRPFSGVQTGQGLAATATAGNTVDLDVANVVFDTWNKNAIDVVTGAGATTGGGDINLTVTGGSMTGRGATSANAQNGIVLWERAGGTVDAIIDGVAISDIEFTGVDAASGILQYASANGRLTIHNSDFSGVERYIALSAGSTNEVDATGNVFDGVAADTATLAELFAIEDGIEHGLDQTGAGLVRVREGQLYVTQSSGSIQRGVNLAATGDTVNVGAGSFSDRVITLNRSVTLRGAQAGAAAATGDGKAGVDDRGGETVLTGAGSYVFRVTAQDVSIDGFTFTGGGGRVIETSGTAHGLSVTNNIFNTASGHASNGVIYLIGSANDVLIANNLFAGNGGAGYLWLSGASGDGLSGLTVRDNDFSGVSDRGLFQGGQSFSGFELSGNYFGAGILTGVNMGHLINPLIEGNHFDGVGYAAMQIGVIGGGTIRDNLVDGTGVTGYDFGAYTAAYGIQIWGGAYGTPPSEGLVIEGNTVLNYAGGGADDRFVGIYIGADAGPDIQVTGNTLDGNSIGLWSASAAQGLTLSENAFTVAGGGLAIRNSGSALIDLTGGANLINGVDTDAASLVQMFGIEDMIDHGVDTAGYGLVSVAEGQLFVTEGSGVDAALRALALADSGDTLNLSAGTHTLTNTLFIQDDSITVAGQGQDQTILDASGHGAYGIRVHGDDVSLAGFTLNGSPAATNASYGVKVEAASGTGASGRNTGFSIADVAINGTRKTGLDLNSVTDVLIDGVTVTGVIAGNGIAITDSAGVTIRDTTTSGNAWGGLALYQRNNFSDQQLSDITVEASNSFGEVNGVYLQQYASALHQADGLTIEGFDFVVQNGQQDGGATTYAWFQKTQQGAVDFAVNVANTNASLVNGWSGSDATGTFTVGVGNLSGGGTRAMSIATAVNAADDGDTVRVLGGTYLLTSTLNIDQSLSLIGAGQGQTLIDGSAVNSYGMLVNADDVSLSGFTFQGNNSTSSGHYGVKVQPDTGAADDRVYDFALSDATIQGWGGSEVDLNGVVGATLTNVTVDGQGTKGLGVGITDSADVTLSGVTTLNNLWGSVALYQTNRFYDQQLTDIHIDAGDNSFGELLGVFAQSYSGIGLEIGDLYLTGFDFTVVNPDHRTDGDDFTFFRTSLDDAIDFAVNLNPTESDASLVQGFDGSDGTGHYYVGVGELIGGGAQALSIQTAFDGSATDDTVHVAAGDYAEALTLNGRRAVEFDAVGVDGLTIAAGAGGSSLAGDLTAGAGGLTFAAAVVLSDDLGLTTTDGGAIDLALVDGATAGGQSLTLVGSGDVTLQAVGSVTGLASLDVAGASVTLAAAFTTGAQRFAADDIRLAGAYQAGGAFTADGAVELTGDVSISGPALAVSLGTVDGAHDLSINAASVSLAQVGGTTALSDLDVVSAAILTAGATTTGDQTYSGPVTLNGAYQAAGFSADAARLGGDVSIAATDANLGGVDGAHALDIDADTVSLGAAGATTALASLTVAASAIDMVDGAVVSGAASLTGPASLGGAFEVGSLSAGPVRLADDLSIDAGGAVTLGAIDGGHGLVVDGGAVVLGVIGSTDTLTSLDVTGATIVTAGASTTGVQSYLGALTLAGAYAASNFSATGPATLAGDTAIDAGGDLTLASVNGGHGLSIDAGGVATLGAVGATAALDSLNVAGASIRTSGAVTTGAQTYSGAVNFAGDYRLTGAGDFTALDGATLRGATAIETTDGDILLGSVNGATAGGQSLTLDAGDGDATVGDFGAQVRLGAVSVHAARTVLQGGVYAGDSLRFIGDEGATVRLTRASTTFNTTRSPNAAGDITLQSHLIGTTSGGQGVFFIAGNGLSSGANGDITLGDAGTDAVRLGVMTVTGDNFSAATVKLADDYTSLLAGDQVFTDQTLDTQGDVVMNIGGDESGSIVALGSVFIDAGGSTTGSLTAGGPVNASYGAGSDRVITSAGPVSLSSTGGVIGGSITSGGAVSVSGGSTVSTTIAAQGNVGITTGGSITSNVTTPTEVALTAGQLVAVTVNAGAVVVNAPGGTVEGVFTDIATPGNATIVVNGEAVVGDGAATARQILTDSFLAPVGGVVGPNGQIELPVGLAIALIAPAGEGAGQRRPIIVNDIERLGELLRLGYTAIVVQIDEGEEPAFEQELDLAQGGDGTAEG
ncbi:MAG: right-handed parallel beta-helix repeat-containing protein [Alphaproteobacteria bacterium]|nr:right-handed parallel beta-helix repeat-containing protein [Alphaproteobacteria bacterium]MBU2269829.1 right-handed parallel beta-helix repeat-containing protein [Alphaproteobacteria bacterium]MBU2419971.1 right-handed parallel beta-helix repeat-containing protein [Alphaproteobacteria bacterium]